MKVKEAYAIYTGGDIWLFYGTTDEGNYFLTDDNGATLILNADPNDDLDAACYDDWQEEHIVRELIGNERKAFCENLLDVLNGYDKTDNGHRGGFTAEDAETYRIWFMVD